MKTKNAYASPHGFANIRTTVSLPVFNNVLLFYNMIAYREEVKDE